MTDAAELTLFIQTNGLDEKAQEALVACEPEVRQAVMQRGSLAECKKPSAACISRINEAKRKARMEGPPMDVEEFIMNGITNGLDEKAADMLREAPAHVQKIVMDRGDLADCRNPSAVVSSRIREATRGIGGDRGITSSGRRASKDEVDSFIASAEVDDRAVEALKDCTPRVQATVIDRGPLSEAKNASAVILSRIKQAKQASGGGMSSGGMGGMMGGSEMEMELMRMMRMRMMFPMGAPSMMMEGGWGDSWGGGGKGWGMGGKGMMGGMGMGGGCWGMSGRGAGKRSGAVNTFIMDNNIDDRAAEMLRDQSAMVQQAVMERGSCADARNPSAVILGRIRDATRGGGRSSPY